MNLPIFRKPQQITLRASNCRISGEKRYGVFIGDIKQSQWMRDEKAAAAFFEKVKKSYRPCMTCNGHFVSEGPQNRLCDRCRKLDTGIM